MIVRVSGLVVAMQVNAVDAAFCLMLVWVASTHLVKSQGGHRLKADNSLLPV